MNTKTSGTEERIDTRTRKAACESMTVIALAEPGEYKVYSGTRSAYVVDLIKETCECPDAEYNPQYVCKHRQRAEMEIGEREIPDLGGRLDVEIMSRRSRETEPSVATDGGVVVVTPQGSGDETTHAPGCDDPECEGVNGDAERPILSFPCWEQWAEYDEEQLIEEAH